MILSSGASRIGRAAWSPDGTLIIFVDNNIGGRQIWLTDTVCRRKTLLVGGDADNFGPAWQP